MSTRIPIALVVALCMPALSTARANGAGAVYAMTNDAGANAIAVYARGADGRLALPEYVPTDGRGSGGDSPLEPVDALGSQGALTLSRDARWLFAVNAGSADISVFRARRNELTLTDKTASGGVFPTSLAVHGRLVYVLNAGNDASIRGFRLGCDGSLQPIPGSTRSLDVGGDDPPNFLESPAQVGFDPSGEHLVVTIKGSNEIRVFSLDAQGVPSAAPVVSPSAGTAPFGFGFDRHQHLIVVEPFGSFSPGTGAAGAVSSYDILPDASLELISESVPNGQTATCWLTIANNGRFAYATNNASSTVTGYRIAADGSLSLLDLGGVTAKTGDNPVDLTLTRDGRFLYTVNAGAGTISAFRVDPASGALTELGEVGGLPVHDGAAGIAAR